MMFSLFQRLPTELFDNLKVIKTFQLQQYNQLKLVCDIKTNLINLETYASLMTEETHSTSTGSYLLKIPTNYQK